jgi:integrase
LKEVGKACGVDKPVEVVKFIGGKRINKAVPKYELITTHTGRRTFITNSLEKGMLPKELMQITGHKNFETLMRYFSREKEEVHQKIISIWDDAPSIKVG